MIESILVFFDRNFSISGNILDVRYLVSFVFFGCSKLRCRGWKDVVNYDVYVGEGIVYRFIF